MSLTASRLAALACLISLVACGGGSADPLVSGQDPVLPPQPPPPSPPPPPPAAVSIRLSTASIGSLGGYVLALRSDGRVLGIGSSTLGGHHPVLGSFVPATPVGTSGAKIIDGLTASSVSTARLYALAVGTDGKLYGWGVSDGGTLGGNVVNGYVDAPRELPGLGNVTMALAGDTQALALRSDGTVWHWPGTSTVVPESSTVGQIAGLDSVVKLVRGPTAFDGTAQEPIAIKSDGSAWTIAWSPTVVMGTSGPVTTFSAVVRRITGLPALADMSCADHCLALATDGTLVAWGQNAHGQLGTGGTSLGGVPIPPGGASAAVTPQPVAGLSGVRSIATTTMSSVAVTADGRVWGWGAGSGSGHGGSADVLVPTPLPGLSDAKEVSCAAGTPCVVRLGSGALWGWGSNGNGELGDGTTTPRETPVLAAGVPLE